MSEFQTKIDVASRACQYLGVPRIDPTQGFNENRKATREIAAVIDKARRLELERSTWRASVRTAVLRAIDTDTMLLVPALWVESATYYVGMVASYDGLLWICRKPDSVGGTPGEAADWMPYFGPLTASLYDSTIAYSSGEIVYLAAGDGTYRVYLSLQDANEDHPATSTPWSSTATYRKDDVVVKASIVYLSLIDLNTGNDPAAAPALWDSTTSYGIGAQVGATDGIIYTSLTGSNLDQDPVSDAGAHWTNTGVLNPWTTDFSGGSGSMKWRKVGGTDLTQGAALETIAFLYPAGAGPPSQSFSRNVFRLPANHVKVAPQDPRAGSYSPLGAPTNRLYEDWTYQDDFFVSGDAGPMLYRFAANIADVTRLPTQFCEMWAARIALMTCESITQSRDKISTIASEYQKFGTEARTANAIEIGPVEEPLDDWIAARV